MPFGSCPLYTWRQRQIAEKTQHMPYFLKAGGSRISNMTKWWSTSQLYVGQPEFLLPSRGPFWNLRSCLTGSAQKVLSVEDDKIPTRKVKAKRYAMGKCDALTETFSILIRVLPSSTLRTIWAEPVKTVKSFVGFWGGAQKYIIGKSIVVSVFRHEASFHHLSSSLSLSQG